MNHAAEKKTRGDQQDNGESELSDDKHATGPPTAFAGRPPALPQRGSRINIRRAERWQEPEQDGGKERGRDGESEHSQIRPYVHIDWNRVRSRRGRGKPRYQAAAGTSQRQAQRSRGKRQQGALSQKLADQTAAVCAQG